MIQTRLFVLADLGLREVIDQLVSAQLDLPAPQEWSSTPSPTLRDILASHARDEAWIPDVLAGRSIDEVGETWNGDLLCEDPIGSYDRFNDAAIAAVTAGDLPSTVHLSYGDYPVHEFLEHVTFYRAFQAPLIAKLAGITHAMSDELVEGLFELVGPQLESLRAIGVFPPEIEPPAGADRETQLLCLVGYWTP